MKLADGVAMFGEWFADLPELDNPGLTEANNCIWTEGGYEPFRPLVGDANGTLPPNSVSAPAYVTAAFGPHGPDLGDDSQYFYAHTNAGPIYKRIEGDSSTAWTAMSATIDGDLSTFAQFDELVLQAGSNAGIFASTVGSSTAFTLLATTGTAPAGRAIGVINRFVVVGNLTGTAVAERAKLQWCAIDNPRNWPTPGTATAVAAQAGVQYLQVEQGSIRQIFGIGHQYGIVLQQGGITRMTYVGGSVVFQFDRVDSNVGSYFPHGAVKVGNLVYFAARHGFYVTDGISVTSISKGKVEEYFSENLIDDIWVEEQLVSCAYEAKRDLIFWSFQNSSAPEFSSAPATSLHQPNKLLIYHRASGRWTSADQEMFCLVSPASANSPKPGMQQDIYGFTSGLVHGQFDGTVGSATFTTAELEHNRGGYSLVQGVKPLVQGTAPAVTVAIGTRNDQNPSSLTYTSATTATASTGFCDFRSSARYHRAKVTVTGEFESAKGVEWQITPQGVR